MKAAAALLAVMATVWQATALAQDFPSNDAVRARIPRTVCYNLVLKITRFDDLNRFPEHKVPLCVDLASAFDVGNVRGNCQAANPTLPGMCGIGFKGDEPYVSVSTQRYSFQVKSFKTQGSWGEDALTYVGGTHLSLRSSIGLGSNWDLRLNQIIYAHRDELPINLPTLVLPTIANTRDSFPLNLNVSWSDAQAAGEAEAQSPIGRIFGVGYDADGASYDVDITMELKSVSYLPVSK